MPQFRASITGRVQGVYFRAETMKTARRLGLRGFARNLPNGQVEVVASGSQEALEDLIAWLHQGPELARVDDVGVDWADETPVGDSFEVRY
jgi:acylphosphatase